MNNMEVNNNPFASFGGIVDGSIFVGRKTETNDIWNRVLGNNFGNVSIVGIPKIGKSSLMQQALKRNADVLWEEHRYIVCWYTFKSVSEEPDHKNVFLYLVDNVIHFLKKHSADDELLEELKCYHEIIKEPNVRWSEFEQNIYYFFEEITYNGIRVIYCIDEFDYSKDILKEAEYQLLRDLSYRNENKIAIVTTSRRSIYDIEHYSGGGSNFYGTFEPVYLKPFSKEETIEQCSLAHIADSIQIDSIYDKFGGHPYLTAALLNKYFTHGDYTKALSEVNQIVLQYYNDLFYVLSKDGLDDKVDKLYCGYPDGVSEEQEDYIYHRYGIFVEDSEGYMIPFSETFDFVLRNRYKENPFHLLWPNAENCLRKAIKYALSEEYGDEDMQTWIDEIRNFPEITEKQFNNWEFSMRNERYLYGSRASNNIIDHLFPKDYVPFIEKYWNSYLKNVFSPGVLSTWKTKIEFIAKMIRNPYAHSRIGLLTEQDNNKASQICQEIIERVDAFFK